MNTKNRTPWIIGGGIAALIGLACLTLLIAGLVFGGARMAGRGNAYERRFGPPAAAQPQQPLPTPGVGNNDNFQNDPRNDAYRGRRDNSFKNDRGGRFQRGRRGFGPLSIIGGVIRTLLTLVVLGGLGFLLVRALRGGNLNWRGRSTAQATPTAESTAPASGSTQAATPAVAVDTADVAPSALPHLDLDSDPLIDTPEARKPDDPAAQI
jgi:hypothetical protein